jgi:chloride channel protein, CIC family
VKAEVVDSPLFRPTYRLLVLSLLVGAIGAFAALGFDFLVDAAERHLLGGIAGYEPPAVGTLTPVVELPHGLQRAWLPVTTTLGALAGALLVWRFAPEAEGHGTDAAIAAYHQHGGEVRARVPAIKAVASALTIGSGGVAGREGPTAQISVGLTTLLARWTGLRGEERRSLLLAGMAAGLAAMFRAPLGMAIFAVEILYSGMVFESEALIYTVIAAVSAYALTGLFTGWHPLFAIPDGVAFTEPASLVAFAVLGVAAGVLGALLPALFYGTRDLFARLRVPVWLKPAIGGLLVGLAAMAAPQILGTGYGWVELAMAGQLGLGMVLLILVLKAPGMALTVGSGASGGIFAPTVTLGAMLGAAVGILVQRGFPMLDAPMAGFVVVGMAAVFAAAARTPISTLIMVVEMTAGYGLIVPAMLANILAFLVQRRLTQGRRYPTLYRSQVERRELSPLHRGVFVRRAVDLLESGDLDASEIRLPRLIHLLRYGEPIRIGQTDGALVALDVGLGSEVDGRSIADTVGRVEGATAVAVMRAEDVLIPRGSTRLLAGDQVLAVVRGEARAALERMTAARAS